MLSSSLKCPKSNKPDKKVKSLTKVEQAKFVNFLEKYTGQHNRNNYSNQLMIEVNNRDKVWEKLMRLLLNV